MPLCFQAYLQGLTANPRFALTVQNSIPQFKLVEIDPLLAYQFHIEVGKADSLGALAGDAPQVADMLPICLPHSFENIACNVSVQPNGMLIRTRSFNLRVFNAGKIGADVAQQFSLAGIAFGPTSPLIQVIRFEGRCYLRNGLHRAYGFRKAAPRTCHVFCLMFRISVRSVPLEGGQRSKDRSWNRQTLQLAVILLKGGPTYSRFEGDCALSMSHGLSTFFRTRIRKSSGRVLNVPMAEKRSCLENARAIQRKSDG